MKDPDIWVPLLFVGLAVGTLVAIVLYACWDEYIRSKPDNFGRYRE